MTDFLRIYLNKYHHRPDLALFRAAEAQRINKFPIGSPVLDIACGDGSFGNSFLPEETVGIDLGFENLKAAVKNGGYLGFTCADARILPFKAEAFETVVSNCALEHIPMVENVVKEVARVLKPGGGFIFTVPSDSFQDTLFPYRFYKTLGMKRKADDYLKRFNAKQEMIHFLSAEQWGEILRDAGLKLVSVSPYLPGCAGMTWNVLWHILSARFPFPHYWREAGVANLVHKLFRGVLNKPWITIVNSLLNGAAVKENKPGQPVAGLAFYAIREK